MVLLKELNEIQNKSYQQFQELKKQLDEQNEFFNKYTETVKKNRIDLLEIKKQTKKRTKNTKKQTLQELNNVIGSLENRVNQMEERISDIKDRNLEINQKEEERN